MYAVEFTEDAREDIITLQKKQPNAVKKLFHLIDELKAHPRTGTGQVEQLKHYKNETWSRRITKKHAWFMRFTMIGYWYWSYPLTDIFNFLFI